MLEIYGIHKLIVDDDDASISVEHIGTAKGAELPSRLVEVLDTFFQTMIDRQEALGKAQAGWWLDDAAPAEIQSLIDCEVEDFDEATRAAMKRLVTSTPGTADGGVVIFVRTLDGKNRQLLCLKLVLSDLSIERLTNALSAASAIAVEDIENVLPKPEHLRKGALIPHPGGAADLKVVDEQTRGPKGTADYWLRFLGARSGIKEPDVGRLVAAVAVPVLEDHGVEDAPSVVGSELRKIAAAEKPTSVRRFVKDIAKIADKPEAEVWKAVSKREPKLAAPDLRVTPAAAQRVVTVIELSDGVTVRGLSTSLNGRYDIIPDPDSDGWILQLKSTEYPRVSHSAKRGQISA